jgi:hypothetical protein
MTALRDEGGSRIGALSVELCLVMDYTTTHASRHEWLYDDVTNPPLSQARDSVLRGQSSISFGDPRTRSFYEPTAVRRKHHHAFITDAIFLLRMYCTEQFYKKLYLYDGLLRPLSAPCERNSGNWEEFGNRHSQL